MRRPRGSRSRSSTATSTLSGGNGFDDNSGMQNAECRMQNGRSFILHSAFCILHYVGFSMSIPQFELKSLAFRHEREKSWRELERLLESVEQGGVASLGAGDIARLPALYRGALSSLSVAR